MFPLIKFFVILNILFLFGCVPNTPPEFIGFYPPPNDDNKYLINIGQTLAIELQAEDEDGDVLTYSVQFAKLHPKSSKTDNWEAEGSNPVFEWTPTKDEAGVYDGVTFFVDDGSHIAQKDTTIVVFPNTGPQIELPKFVQPSNPTITWNASQLNHTIFFQISWVTSSQDEDNNDYLEMAIKDSLTVRKELCLNNASFTSMKDDKKCIASNHCWEFKCNSTVPQLSNYKDSGYTITFIARDTKYGIESTKDFYIRLE